MVDFDNLIGYRRSENKDGKVPPENRPLIPGQEASYKGRMYSLARIETDLNIVNSIKSKNARKLAFGRANAFHDFIEKKSDQFSEMVSIEWVGQKIQQTPGQSYKIGVEQNFV